MTGKVSFLGLDARDRRRDALIEHAFATLSEIRDTLTTDADHFQLADVIEQLKRLRRPEVVAEMERARMAKASL